MGLAAERNFSELLRASGDVLHEAEHRDVLLRRRDGADMMLVEAEREEGLRDALVMAVQIVATVRDAGGRDLERRLPDVAPWTAFLTTRGRKEFLSEFIRTARACGEMDTFAPLAQLLREWKSTAAVRADPQLLAVLRAPAEEERRVVPRP